MHKGQKGLCTSFEVPTQNLPFPSNKCIITLSTSEATAAQSGAWACPKITQPRVAEILPPLTLHGRAGWLFSLIRYLR